MFSGPSSGSEKPQIPIDRAPLTATIAPALRAWIEVSRKKGSSSCRRSDRPLFLCTVPVLAETKTYTTTADFDEGIYINLNATPMLDQLQVNTWTQTKDSADPRVNDGRGCGDAPAFVL